jgi:hypothetical protein
MILGEYPYPWILTKTSIMEKKFEEKMARMSVLKYVN